MSTISTVNNPNNTINRLSNFEAMGLFTCQDRLDYLKFLDSLKAEADPKNNLQLQFYDVLKAQYFKGGCGVDYKRDMCFDYEVKIGQLQTSVEKATKERNANNLAISQKILNLYKAEFEKNGCEAKINEVKTGMLSGLVSDYQQIDEQRIAEQTSKMVRQRVIIGAITVVIGFMIILYKTKKK